MSFGLLACGETEEPTGVIPKHQLKVLEDAKEVEGLLQQKMQDQKDALGE
jgi:hypothetical protein